jgi:hypothetical protein
VIERMVDDGIARIAPTVADPNRSALEKLEGFFGGMAEYKTEHRDLILGFLRTWLSDDNAIVREHFRRGLVGRLEPVMTMIVRQGVAEGTFTVNAPEAAARVLVALVQGANEAGTELFIAYQRRELTLEDVALHLDAFREAFERILGAPAGSVRLADPKILGEWFDHDRMKGLQ